MDATADLPAGEVAEPALARATHAVSSGTLTLQSGRIDITHSSGILRDSCPRKTGPGRDCSQPNTKIPDRAKLSVLEGDNRLGHAGDALEPNVTAWEVGAHFSGRDELGGGHERGRLTLVLEHGVVPYIPVLSY